MLWLLTRIIVWPAQLAAAVTVLSARATALGARSGWRTARFVGLRRIALLGTGVAVGLMVAPWSGREMRERLKPRPDGQGNMVWAPFGDVIRISTSDDVPAATPTPGSGRHPLHVPMHGGEVEAHVERAPTGEVDGNGGAGGGAS